MKLILMSSLMLAMLLGCSKGVDQSRVEALEQIIKATKNDCPVLKVGQGIEFFQTASSERISDVVVTEISGRWFRVKKAGIADPAWWNLDQVIRITPEEKQ